MRGGETLMGLLDAGVEEPQSKRSINMCAHAQQTIMDNRFFLSGKSLKNGPRAVGCRWENEVFVKPSFSGVFLLCCSFLEA